MPGAMAYSSGRWPGEEGTQGINSSEPLLAPPANASHWPNPARSQRTKDPTDSVQTSQHFEQAEKGSEWI